jgi:hypothetical protein
MSVAFVIQHAVRMRRVVLLSVVSLTAQYILHYLINGTIFGKKNIC